VSEIDDAIRCAITPPAGGIVARIVSRTPRWPLRELELKLRRHIASQNICREFQRGRSFRSIDGKTRKLLREFLDELARVS
jgi:hypothetical protein